MHRRTTAKAAFVAIATLVATTPFTGGSAKADYAPSATDVVGVGAETLNFAMDFLGDGDYNGNLGYNSANNPNKWINFDSTADANARNTYANGSTLTSVKNLNPTIVVRAGTSPIQRPTTSGNSFSNLLGDTGTPHKIDYIKSIALPTAAQQTTASNNGWGFLHVVKIGSDPLEIVAANTTNAPAGLTIQDLVKIYNGTWTMWNQVDASLPAETIIPLITPVGAGTRNSFQTDLLAACGGCGTGSPPVFPFSGNVRTVEPNDPNGITSLSDAERPNAIMPFAVGRLFLFQQGYFKDPTVILGKGTTLAAGVKPVTGTPPGGGTAWTTTLGIYIVFRQTDAASPTPMQPGSTKNWVQTLFSDPSDPTGPFVSKPAGQALIAASGITPTYQDLGNVSAG